MKIGVLTITEADNLAPESHRAYCAIWQYEHLSYRFDKENPADLFGCVSTITKDFDWTLVVHQKVDLGEFGIPLDAIARLAQNEQPLILLHAEHAASRKWPSLFDSFFLVKYDVVTKTFLDIGASTSEADIVQRWDDNEYGSREGNADDRCRFAAYTSRLVDRALVLPLTAANPNVGEQPPIHGGPHKGTQKIALPVSRVPANVRYWTEANESRNFGDYLTEYFFERLFYGVDINARSIHVVGSVISDEWVVLDNGGQGPTADHANTTLYWACGARGHESLSPQNRNKCRIAGVRGPLTRDALALPKDTPLGDPGLLLPALYSPKRDAGYAGKTVVVPHIGDPWSHDELKMQAGCDVVLSPEVSPSIQALEAFIDRIASASFVLCGSLHAAVTAAAYGVPFAYLKGGRIDIPFKWRDFSASINIPCRFVENIAAGTDHYRRAIKPALRLPVLTCILLVAPFPVRPKALLNVYERDVNVHGIQAVRSIANTREHPFFMDFYGAVHSEVNPVLDDGSPHDAAQPGLEPQTDKVRQTGKLKMEVWRHSSKK